MATLYRKYRSKTFDEVIGQEPIVTTLTNQVKLGRIGHAYLFTGSRGTGKTSCARIFARAVNCLHPVNGSPCGRCEVCKKLDSPDNVDIIEMDAASNNGVDDARDIREKVKYLPTSCKYKVYIIDEVHMLTGGAFNALLKTIEEPPEHVIFILATTEPQKLPQTILSRCIRFDFRLVDTETLAAHIAKIYRAEGVKFTDDAVFEIARQGEGSVRDALSVADTLMSAADCITTDVVLSLTGAGDSSAIGDLFDCVAARNVAGALEKIDAFARRGKSMAAVAHQLTTYARNVIVAKSAPNAVQKGLINVDKATAERIYGSTTFPMREISNILENAANAESGLKYSVNPRVYLETALIKTMCAADVTAELTRRITALENKISADPAEQKKNNALTPERTQNNVIGASRADTVSSRSTATVSSYGRDASPQKVRAASPERRAEYGYEPPPEPEYGGRADEYVKQSAPEPTAQASLASAAKTAPMQNPAQVSQKTSRASATAEEKSGQSAVVADEGEFMQYSAQKPSGLMLYGKVLTYLRKKGTYASARARDLLSRDGVAVKEREDAIAFVVPDEIFLSLSDAEVKADLDAALDSVGIKKRARPERTAEDLYLDDLEKMRSLFGRDCVTPA